VPSWNSMADPLFWLASVLLGILERAGQLRRAFGHRFFVCVEVNDQPRLRVLIT
jgi:hypothetical protein